MWTPYEFEYPYTRKFTWKKFHNILLLILFIWFLLVVLNTFAAQLYENVSTYSTDFNGTTTLWYQYVIPPTPWIAPPKTCLGSLIKVQECMHSSVLLTESIAVATTGRFGYLVNGFIDSQSGQPIDDGMMYKNYELQSCYVQSIVFKQFNLPTTDIQVSLVVFPKV